MGAKKSNVIPFDSPVSVREKPADKPAEDTRQDEFPVSVLTILFTDLVGSTAIKSEYGIHKAQQLENMHKNLLLDALKETKSAYPHSNSQVIRVEGDSYLFIFPRPSEAIYFALTAQHRHHQLRSEKCPELPEFRVGIHMGEVIVEQGANPYGNISDIKGLQVDLSARIMSLAHGGQILCSRTVSDDARQALKGTDIKGIRKTEWKSHGLYLLKGREEAFEICEVGESGIAPFDKPSGNEKARPVDSKANLQFADARQQKPAGPDFIKLAKPRRFLISRKSVYAISAVLIVMAAVYMGVQHIPFFTRQTLKVLKTFKVFKPEPGNEKMTNDQSQMTNDQSGPAPAEIALEKLESEVIKLRGTFESIDDYGTHAADEVRDKAPALARQILNIADHQIDTAHKISKYLIAAYATVMAASAEQNNAEKLKYADQGIQLGNKSIELIEEIRQQASGGDPSAQKLYNEIISKHRTEMTRFMLAVCFSIKAQHGDKAAVQNVEENLNAIPAAYKERYPLEMEPHLKWFLESSRSISRDAYYTLRGNELLESSSSAMKTGTYKALVIGISIYKSPEITTLISARNDASAVASVLRDKYGFSVELLTDEQASGKAITDALQSLLNTSEKDDCVLIYYAGHGKLLGSVKKPVGGWWIPYDASISNTNSFVSNADVLTIIKGVEARHVMLISDSCYAGTFFSQSRDVHTIQTEPCKYKYEKKSRWAWTSGNIQPVQDGGSAGHSFFAKLLLRELQDNTNECLPAWEIHRRIEEPVENNNPGQDAKCGVLLNAGDEGGEFVFVLPEQNKEASDSQASDQEQEITRERGITR